MAYCRKLNKNKNYVNCYSLNGLFVLVFTMILMFKSVSSTLETESKNTSCSNAITCTKCTIKAQCQWSLEQQNCIKKTNFSNLIASTIGECPQFSVDKQYNYDSSFISLKYTFKVSNDSVGFTNYLRTSQIFLRRTSSLHSAIVKQIINDSFIFSFNTPTEYFNILNNQSITEFLFIEFNNVTLRFDNVADHYVTFYRPNNECDNYEKKEFCATCAWNYNGYANYLRWCSNKTLICEGRKQLYLKNRSEEIFPINRFVDQRIEEAYVTNDCSEVKVIAVHPLSGPHTGGTVVTITVKNHRILAEDQTILVMVAGTVCTNPRTLGSETITCTTSPWVNVTGGPPALGPILVKYSSDKGRLTIESSQRFQYDVHPTCGSPKPVLDAEQQLRASEFGDIVVPVRGVHFVTPCVASSARLFVKLPDGIMQFASSYCDIPVNDTYMVCRSPRVDSRGWPDRNLSDEGLLLNFGLNVMYSIGNQSLSVEGPSGGFHVLFDPVLVDFNIIKSNGSIVFNGRYLNHLQSDVVLMRLPNSSATGCESVLDCAVVVCCKNVMISEQRIICKPNMTIAPAATTSRNILVTIGDRLSYTVPNKSLPPAQPSIFSGWRSVVIWLSACLFIVCVLLFYLRNRSQYRLTKSVDDPSVTSTRSQAGLHYDIILNS
ncbi:uncharacterized protein LOC113548336 [Rhopalosiphum maidis]|uniref:uncharacterized protein LOC113548336 n=1 Tax=Rhopalosiphum maidis TaxID=43146 RepID=UPI000EFEF914|nr:uncharacterized protein LOC113548336 [Rhopalosiphum maidis]XP_026804966.1 uncharacterized protein LOC113548336 [Rhopalosiphum maidis]